MALTQDSLAAAAKRKTQRAQEHVKSAEADLKEANEKFKEALPTGDSGRIREAHGRTQEAEKAVARAAEELEAVNVLLHPSPEGAKELLERRSRP